MAKQKKNKEKHLNYYAVAFMDLLGQQKFLRNLNTLPDHKNKKEIDKFKPHIKNTYGAVTAMRNIFNDDLNGYGKEQLPKGVWNRQQKEELKKDTNNPIKMQNFSDSTVIFMSLQPNEKAKNPMRGIFGILGAAAKASIYCLSIGHPIRGGIDVGIGMEITKNDFYGPALSRAYTMESKTAQYPRIIIGEELCRYLVYERDKKIETISDAISKKTAEFCIQCIAKDDDGNPFLDYLGKPYRDLFGKKFDATVIKTAYDQVLKFLDKYQREKNKKLIPRYQQLKNYFDYRLPLWEDLFK